jgi:hypothetical protein
MVVVVVPAVVNNNNNKYYLVDKMAFLDVAWHLILMGKSA